MPAIAVMLVTSLLTPRQMRRVALVVFIVSFMMVVATLFFGAEVKGARRWIVLLGINIQPSEFLKPAFVVLISWLFAESPARSDVPADDVRARHAGRRCSAFCAAARFRPDDADSAGVGSAVLHGGHAVDLGDRARRHGGRRARRRLCTIPHVAKRIKRFLDPASGDTFQVDTAVESFCRGGWFGRGPGEGRSNASSPTATPTSCLRSRPRSSASCCASSLVALFAFIVLRALSQGDAQ